MLTDLNKHALDPSNARTRLSETDRLAGMPFDPTPFEHVGEWPKGAKGCYLSTACLHDEHESCRLNCKFCVAFCSCGCHRSQASGTESSTTTGVLVQKQKSE